MNERIKQLAEQADKWSAEEYHQLFLANESPDRQKLFKEKFAELIVRECASIVEDAVNHREPASTYVDKIKQHFGVEK